MMGCLKKPIYYIGSAEGHEYPDLQVGDEVNPRTIFAPFDMKMPSSV